MYVFCEYVEIESLFTLNIIHICVPPPSPHEEKKARVEFKIKSKGRDFKELKYYKKTLSNLNK